MGSLRPSCFLSIPGFLLFPFLIGLLDLSNVMKMMELTKKIGIGRAVRNGAICINRNQSESEVRFSFRIKAFFHFGKKVLCESLVYLSNKHSPRVVSSSSLL